jgi:hypothetical protein
VRDGLPDKRVGVRHSVAILDSAIRQVNESYRFALDTKADLGQCLINGVTAELTSTTELYRFSVRGPRIRASPPQDTDTEIRYAPEHNASARFAGG